MEATAEDCTILLEFFLKRLDIAWSEQRELRVASLGGGPVFDAMAVLASVAALKEASERQPECVRCKVLDLSPAWATSLSAVSDVASEIWPGQRADFIELAPCDLRDPKTAKPTVCTVGTGNEIMNSFPKYTMDVLEEPWTIS